MSERSTPLTDAQWERHMTVWKASGLEIWRLSRRLERDRKELMAALKRIQKWDFDIRGDCVAQAKSIAQVALIKVKDQP